MKMIKEKNNELHKKTKGQHLTYQLLLACVIRIHTVTADITTRRESGHLYIRRLVLYVRGWERKSY